MGGVNTVPLDAIELLTTGCEPPGQSNPLITTCPREGHVAPVGIGTNAGATMPQNTETDDNGTVCDICALCFDPGADTMYNGSSGAWVHASCLDEPARLEAVAEGKCFFCFGDGRDLVPFIGPLCQEDWDDTDDLAWVHLSCVARYEAALGRAMSPKPRSGCSDGMEGQ